MATCLVTGGCGFIGSHLVEALARGGHQVRVLDDLSTGRRENLQGVGERIDFLLGSVTDADAVRSAVQGREWIFHLAALPSVPRSLEDPMATHAVCATGTLHVLEAARLVGVKRVIYTASSSAYGGSTGVVKREDDCLAPLSPYAAAKLAGEHYCSCYTSVYGLETVRLRLFNVFGPRQTADSPYTGVIALFLAALCTGLPPTIYGDGIQSRDFTYVDNAVQALLRAAVAPSAPGNVYNIGNGARTTVRALLDHLNQLLGCDVQPVYGPPRPGDVRHAQADITRAQSDLQYQPHISLAEGLRRTAEACQGGHRGSCD
jgi:UDP-glucose 4-epimerase